MTTGEVGRLVRRSAQSVINDIGRGLCVATRIGGRRYIAPKDALEYARIMGHTNETMDPYWLQIVQNRMNEPAPSCPKPRHRQVQETQEQSRTIKDYRPLATS